MKKEFDNTLLFNRNYLSLLCSVYVVRVGRIGGVSILEVYCLMSAIAAFWAIKSSFDSGFLRRASSEAKRAF